MQLAEMPAGHVLNLRVGDIVEVRSEAEILATLDEQAELESLPFMPEMLQFCGRRFRVDKLAVKLCDTISSTGMYRMHNIAMLQGSGFLREKQVRFPTRRSRYLLGSYELRIFETVDQS